MKKFLAFLLVFVIVAGVFPVEILASAPFPARRTRVTMTNASFSSVDPPESRDDLYHLRFEWRQPRAGSLIQLPTNSTDGSHLDYQLPTQYLTTWTQFASEFDFVFTNRFAGNSHTITLTRSDLNFPTDAEINPDTPLVWDTRTSQHGRPEFTPGNFYEIAIVPQRNVPVATQISIPPNVAGDPPGIGYTWSYPRDTSPIETIGTPLRMAFMSNIRVSAEGVGNEIEVRWDNPIWRNGGQTYEFPYWHITVWDGANAVAGTPLIIENTEAARSPNGRELMYTLDHLSLVVGRAYHVSVEPATGPLQTNQIRRASTIVLPDETGTLVPHLFASRTQATRFQDPVPVLIMPRLDIQTSGDNFIRLNWPAMSQNPIERIVIEEWITPIPSPDMLNLGDNPPRIVADLPMPFAASVTMWNVGRLTPMTERAFTIRVENAQGVRLGRSNMVFFNPELAEFTPYSPTLENITYTLLPGGTQVQAGLTLTWHAFLRAPQNAFERLQPNHPPGSDLLLPPGREYIDMDIRYRVFISDRWDNLNWPDPNRPFFAPLTLPSLDPAALTMLTPLIGSFHVPMYTHGVFDRYTGINPTTGEWEVRPIQDNSILFIRIEAVRELQGRNMYSTPSFGVINIPPGNPLQMTPEMIDSPPLTGWADNVLGTPPRINLQWDLRYVEIADIANIDETNETDEWDRWYASVGIRRANNVPVPVFGRTAPLFPHVENWASLNQMIADNAPQLRTQLLNYPSSWFQNPGNLSGFLNDARKAIFDYLEVSQSGLPPHLLPLHPLRVRDMYPNRYRIHVVEYNDVLATGPGLPLGPTFEAYRDELAENVDLWRSIGRPDPAVSAVPGTSSFVVTEDFRGNALKPNTAYIVFFQPYTTDNVGVQRLSFRPNYVIVTVPDIFDPSVPRPTTPVLFPGDPATDSTVSVRWRLQGGDNPNPQTQMRFELRWSESILAHPNNTGFVHLSWDDMTALWQSSTNPDGQKRFVNTGGNQYHHFTIENLFPDTAHYVWIRAYNADNIFSGWSNPIDIRTREITIPHPPGLGLVNRSHLNAHNLANDTDYAPIEPNAIFLLLTRTISDYRLFNLPRAAGGEATGGSAELIDIANMRLRDYAIRFSELNHNRDYYARARTIVTITRGEARTYTYEIQLADNEDFLDATTFMLPALPEFNPQTMRRAESPWVGLQVSTAPSADEYDGMFRPEQFPLPDDDWEITYTGGVLLWRFRTHRIGADGRPDQQVNQRFISRLIDSRIHRYEIDLSSYIRRPDWPVSNRELEIPWSILQTFDERLITLDINFGDIRLSVPPGTFNTAAVRGLNMGRDSFVRIGMLTNTAGTGLPSLPSNNRFSSLPQRLNVTAVTPQRSLTVNEFAQPITATAHLDDIIGPDGIRRVNLFFSSPLTGTWQTNNGMVMQTFRPGTFAAVSQITPPTTVPNDPSFIPMQRVTARLNFTDLHTYNPSLTVGASVFNNVMHALTNNHNSVTTGAFLPPADRLNLERARMLAPPELTYESAVDILIRFYELRTRRIIQPLTTPGMLPGITHATPALQPSLLKAADIGFINGPINPTGALTMGDLMVMLDIVITDTGF